MAVSSCSSHPLGVGARPSPGSAARLSGVEEEGPFTAGKAVSRLKPFCSPSWPSVATLAPSFIMCYSPPCSLRGGGGWGLSGLAGIWESAFRRGVHGLDLLVRWRAKPRCVLAFHVCLRESSCQLSGARGRVRGIPGAKLPARPALPGETCLCTCKSEFQVEWPCVPNDLLFSLLMVTLWIWGT